MASIVLTHGDAKAEVHAVANYEDLACEAQEQFGLHPESFNFFDQYGMIEGSKLHRALQGPCVLEVREKPEWRRMREMSAQIEALMAAQQGQVVHVAEAEIEGKILAKVDAAVAKLREDLDRTDAKVERALAPMVQSMALQHMDIVARLQGVDLQAMRLQLDALEKSIAELPTAPQKDEAHDIDGRLQAACARAELAAANVEELRASMQVAASDVIRPCGSPPSRGSARRPDASPVTPVMPKHGHFSAGPQWGDVMSSKKPAGLGFSAKSWVVEAGLDAAELAASSFMGSPSAGKFERKQMQGCRSLPFLPRVC
mmetsp:Transcript_7929/g.20490  ORF Transcript_7929/g.20490 Transcript_7929/m.20490 type:complete len:314 (+) Transcript_7929:100-1041(+)